MKVQRSCHVALFGSSLREAVVVMMPMLATAARENADVAVKTVGATWVASVIAVVFRSGKRRGWSDGVYKCGVATSEEETRLGTSRLGRSDTVLRWCPLASYVTITYQIRKSRAGHVMPSRLTPQSPSDASIIIHHCLALALVVVVRCCPLSVCFCPLYVRPTPISCMPLLCHSPLHVPNPQIISYHQKCSATRPRI